MEYAIEVKDLVKRYKDFVALSHFDLEVKEGEILRPAWTEWVGQDDDDQLYLVVAYIRSGRCPGIW